MNSPIHLILGGNRSGKSLYAEQVASRSRREVIYVATYSTEKMDPEMQKRIEAHRARRPRDWKTIENRFDFAEILCENNDKTILIDSLTLWLSYWQMQGKKEKEILSDLEKVLKLDHKKASLIIVSDEVGMGLVPENAEARIFRDLCGKANQLIAQHAATIEFVIAGLPLALKKAS